MSKKEQISSILKLPIIIDLDKFWNIEITDHYINLSADYSIKLKDELTSKLNARFNYNKKDSWWKSNMFKIDEIIYSITLFKPYKGE